VKQIHKDYGRPFLLEPTKLTRIVDKIHDRLDELKQTEKHDRFEVFMRGERREEMATVEDVLALENLPRQKIERLLMVFSAITESPERRSHEVQVDFGAPKTRAPGEPHSASGKVIAVTVRSDDAGWASRTLSEVEEQVERTWQQRHTSAILMLLVIVLFAILVFASQFIRIATSVPTLNWLQPADVDRVAQMIGDGGTLTDEQAREVATLQLRNVVVVQRQEQPPQLKGGARKLVLFGIPLLLVLGCSIALFRSYPAAVFLWGDEVERHTNRVQTRRVVWGVLIGVVASGIVGKLLYEGVAPWIPSG
jgi:hypothetical protein